MPAEETPKADQTLASLLNAYSTIKAEKDDLEKQLDEVDERLKPARQAVIDAMVAQEFQRVSHQGTTYYLQVPARPSIVPERRGEFIAWLRGHNEDGIIQSDYINSNTLYGWFNRLDDEQKQELEGMVKVSEEIQLRSPKDYVRQRSKR